MKASQGQVKEAEMAPPGGSDSIGDDFEPVVFDQLESRRTQSELLQAGVGLAVTAIACMLVLWLIRGSYETNIIILIVGLVLGACLAVKVVPRVPDYGTKFPTVEWDPHNVKVFQMVRVYRNPWIITLGIAPYLAALLLVGVERPSLVFEPKHDAFVSGICAFLSSVIALSLGWGSMCFHLLVKLRNLSSTS
jgi:hypothetical protein